MKPLTIAGVRAKLEQRRKMAERHVPMPDANMEKLKREFHQEYQDIIHKTFMKSFVSMIKEVR